MAKKLPNPTPFQDCTVYGPYLGKQENRYIVVTKHNITGKLNTYSLARYKLCCTLSRLLTVQEEADHINNDKTDDVDENLQVLSAYENKVKDKIGQLWVTLICPQCGIDFDKPRNKTHIIRKMYKHTTCSRSCRAKWSANDERYTLEQIVIAEFRKPLELKS